MKKMGTRQRVFFILMMVMLLSHVPLQSAPVGDLSQENLNKTILYKGGYIPDIDLQGDLLSVAAIETNIVYDISQNPATEIYTYPQSTSRTTDIDPTGQWVAFNAFGGEGERTEVIPSNGSLLEVHTEGQYAVVNDIQWVNDIVLEANRFSYTATREGNIWLAADSDNVVTVMAHDGSVNSLSLSSTGVLASGGEDGRVKFWVNQTLTETIEMGQAVKQVQWSPVSSQLAVRFEDGTVKIWENNQTQTLPLEATTLVWSPDGTRLALGQASGEIVLWDIGNSSVANTIVAHTGQVTALAWSDRHFASAGLDGKVQLWNTSWTIEQTIEPVECCLTNLISNGTLFLFQQQALIWEWNNGTQTLRPIFFDEIKLKDLVISPTGRYLAIRGYQKTPEYLALYERLEGGSYQLLATTTEFYEDFGRISVMQFKADESALVGIIDRTIEGFPKSVIIEWSIPNLTPIQINSTSGAPDGAMAIAPDGTIAFMANRQALVVANNIDLEAVYQPIKNVFAMDYSDAGQYLAIGGDAHTNLLQVSDLEIFSSTCRTQLRGDAIFVYPTYVDFIANDSVLVCANTQLILWDVVQATSIQAYSLGLGDTTTYDVTTTNGMQVSADESQIFIIYNNEFQVWQAED